MLAEWPGRGKMQRHRFPHLVGGTVIPTERTPNEGFHEELPAHGYDCSGRSNNSAALP
jgi:hypothetical protein